LYSEKPRGNSKLMTYPNEEDDSIAIKQSNKNDINKFPNKIASEIQPISDEKHKNCAGHNKSVYQSRRDIHYSDEESCSECEEVIDTNAWVKNSIGEINTTDSFSMNKPNERFQHSHELFNNLLRSKGV